jgi:hypothetical protein
MMCISAMVAGQCLKAFDGIAVNIMMIIVPHAFRARIATHCRPMIQSPTPMLQVAPLMGI